MKTSMKKPRPMKSRGATVMKVPGQKAVVFKQKMKPPITSGGPGKRAK